jgi:amino acid adenylation domain-containing protein
MLLADWLVARAQARPEATAVMGDARLTYGDLEARANRLARMLRATGCGPRDRVVVLAPKSAAAIVGILGALKAGAMYVPLDAASPPARLAAMIRACEPRSLLVTHGLVPLVVALAGEGALPASLTLGWLGPAKPPVDVTARAFSLADCETLPDTAPAPRNEPCDPAYLLFTSGSTGAPKGVVVTHASVVRFVEWGRAYFGLGESDRLSGHPPLHFDLSVFDLFGTLAAGAELHLVPVELGVSARALAAFIRARALTQWFSVPSVLSYLAKFGAVGDFPALRRVLWCGEVLPTPVLRHWMTRLPHVRFTNLYGPTETTIASSYYTLPACPEDDGAEIPIGTGCDGEELLVLDEARRPVAPGEAGDLYIRGAGLSPGYWRDPERTAAAFLPDPRAADPAGRVYRTGDRARLGPDGLVYFLGRADSQVKSRGYRIELGEIEAALHGVETLQESAVVALPSGGFEGVTLCCAYAPAPGAQVTPLALRQALGRRLPAYMLPSRWMALASLPKNASGKIDRRRLAEAFRDAT